ncbi:hypothetical protein [Bradyrhizobium elkanii]|uniref:hypothetical protein n=1 Tax=Bradyrhizobium elkanii TaxID=29448 RepID=UPI00114CCCF6|nr:hypothetical protein [Bradyrhizobium elkanii]
MATTAGVSSDDGYAGSIKADIRTSIAVRTLPDQRKGTRPHARVESRSHRKNWPLNAFSMSAEGTIRASRPDLRRAGEG